MPCLELFAVGKNKCFSFLKFENVGFAAGHMFVTNLTFRILFDVNMTFRIMSDVNLTFRIMSDVNLTLRIMSDVNLTLGLGLVKFIKIKIMIFFFQFTSILSMNVYILHISNLTKQNYTYAIDFR